MRQTRGGSVCVWGGISESALLSDVHTVRPVGVSVFTFIYMYFLLFHVFVLNYNCGSSA